MAETQAETQGETKALQRVASGSMAWVLVLMAALWVLLVGGLHRDETIVGIFSVLGAGAMFWLVARVRGMQMRFTAGIWLPAGACPGTPCRICGL